MEPFLALGQLLEAHGHNVRCAFPEQFRDLATQSGLAFASLGKKFIELLESDDGKAAMGGASGWKPTCPSGQYDNDHQPVKRA